MTQIQISRRQFTAGALGLLAAPSLAALIEACAGPGNSPAPAAVGPEVAGGTARIAWWGAADRAKRTQQVLDLFTAQYPLWKFDSSFSSFSSYWDKLNTQAAGGALPDIIQMDMSKVSRFASRNQLLDLNPYVGKEINLSDFDKGQREMATVNGKLTGISLGGNTQCLIYNETLLNKVGAPVPTGKMNWEQLLSYCKQVQPALPQGAWVMPDYGGDPTPFEVFVRDRNKKELYTSDGQPVFTRADVLAWYDMWAQFREAGVVVPETVAQTTVGQPSMVRGTSAVGITWSPLFTQWQVVLKDQTLRITAPPGAPTGTYVKSSMLFCVSAKTQAPHMTAAFLNFWVNNPQAVGILGLDRGIPAPAKARDSLKPSLSPSDLLHLNYVGAQGNNSRPKTVLDPPWASSVGDSLGRNAQSISLAHVSTAAAADKFMADVNKALTL
jgi:multiple sugar transport system substrate-binding protein